MYVRIQGIDRVTMERYAETRANCILGIRSKTASDWLITLTDSRKPFSPTSVYFDDASSGPNYNSPHGFLRLQLLTKGSFMLDEQSCNLLRAEDVSTPRVYERAYHSCKYIYIYIYITQSTRCPYSILCSLFVHRAQVTVRAWISTCICTTWLTQ